MFQSLNKNYQKNSNAREDFLLFFKRIISVLTVFYTLTWFFLEAWYCFFYSVLFACSVGSSWLITNKKYLFYSALLLSVSFVFIIVSIITYTNGLQSPFVIWLFVTVSAATSLLGKSGAIVSTASVVIFFLMITFFNLDFDAINELDASYYNLMYTVAFLSGTSLIGLFAWRNIFKIEKENDLQKNLQITTSEINNELLRKEKEQKKLLSIVSHELRTPAATLSMLLNPKDLANHNLDEPLITKTMNHLMDVLNDMRMVKEPKLILETEKRKVFIREIIQSSVNLLASYVENKNLVITIHELKENRFLCLVRDRLIKQIAMNIIKNCINHANATTLDIYIAVKNLGENYLFTILFYDNGQGIPDHKVATLFTPFVKGVEKSSGSGLGLHLSREFAQKGLHGNLTYRKNSPTGAIFELEFTALKAEKTSTDILQETTPITNNSLKGLTILLAEDNLVIALMTKKLLEEQGATVLDAKDGEVALTLFKSNSIDVVLTDIFMPKINGYELTKALRTLGYKGQIIGCSAASIGEEANKLIASGADKVFIKPLQIDDFLQYVQNANENIN